MSIKRGVSLYSYQQLQFFKVKNLWEQIEEVREGLGTDGVEIISESAIPRYPFPPNAFVDQWHETMGRLEMKPVAYDAFFDVLQFRDHLMDLDEAADRLKRDIRIAHRMGFGIVRTPSPMSLELHEKALPLAEELGVVMAKEIHAPMSLQGPDVAEIVEFRQRTGSEAIGLLIDFGVFQVRINQPTVDWYTRHGCSPEAVDFAQRLCDENIVDHLDPAARSFESHQLFLRNVLEGVEPPPAFQKAIGEYVKLCKTAVPDPSPLEWDLFGWSLKLPRSTGAELEEITPHVFGCHGKFYGMTEVPGRPGEYEDRSVDTAAAVAALKRGGYDGYIDSENEGQRHYQDLDREFYQDEVEQVRRHHEMLARLIDQDGDPVGA